MVNAGAETLYLGRWPRPRARLLSMPRLVPLPVAGHGQGGDKSFKLCDNSAGGAGQVFARHPETDG